MLWNCPGVMIKKNQTELRVKLLNQSQIVFKSGESFDNLRGETLHFCIIDEVRDQSPNLWTMVVRPMLTTTKGHCRFISTPNGFDHFYDIFEFAGINESQGWARLQAPSTCNPMFTEDEMRAAKSIMTEPQFDQEIMANFREMTAGKVYISHGEHNQLPHTLWATNDPERQVTDKLPLILGLDFNLSPMSWHLGQHDRQRYYWFDEIHLEGSHTQEASGALIEKLMALKARGLMRSQPQIIVCGDATGKAGQRAAAGQSDYDIVLGELKRHGFTFNNVTPDANPMVKDRVNNMNSKLRAADGSVSIFYNPITCPSLKKDFDRVTWKNGILNEGKNKELTHASDSVGYVTSVLTPMQSIIEVGVPRVVVL